MPQTSLSLKITKNQGENAINAAKKLDLINVELIIRRENGDLLIPLNRQPSDIELAKLENSLPLFKFETTFFENKNKPSQTIAQALESQIPPELLSIIPQAFDVIGDIIIIEIPPQLKSYQTLIGEALLRIHKNIRTILGKASDINGVYRIRDYDFIAGEQKTRTTHREFGCTFYVDVAKAYFSPRLSNEHRRVAAQVQAGEVVADLFAGVGPFSILIGKKFANLRVYAVDLNPDAVELLKMNVKVNKVDERVLPILGDAREVSNGKLKALADRVIMNLPETASNFIDAACNTIKPEGGIVHFYSFVRSPDTVDNLKQRFSDAIRKCDRQIESFVFCRSIRETAPFESQVVLDVKIK